MVCELLLDEGEGLAETVMAVLRPSVEALEVQLDEDVPVLTAFCTLVVMLVAETAHDFHGCLLAGG
jgi:hypothetical protein